MRLSDKVGAALRGLLILALGILIGFFLLHWSMKR